MQDKNQQSSNNQTKCLNEDEYFLEKDEDKVDEKWGFELKDYSLDYFATQLAAKIIKNIIESRGDEENQTFLKFKKRIASEKNCEKEKEISCDVTQIENNLENEILIKTDAKCLNEEEHLEIQKESTEVNQKVQNKESEENLKTNVYESNMSCSGHNAKLSGIKFENKNICVPAQNIPEEENRIDKSEEEGISNNLNDLAEANEGSVPGKI